MLTAPVVASSSTDAVVERRFPVGAEAQPDGGTHFRVWAPATDFIEAIVDRDGQQAAFALEAEEGGYWAEVPAIPGCATQGDTFEELLQNLYEAITGCLNVEIN